MRTTIDIPDATYRELKVRAARDGVSVRKLVLDAVQRSLTQPAALKKPFVIPIIPSSRPGTLELTNEQIDDILFSS